MFAFVHGHICIIRQYVASGEMFSLSVHLFCFDCVMLCCSRNGKCLTITVAHVDLKKYIMKYADIFRCSLGRPTYEYKFVRVIGFDLSE